MLDLENEKDEVGYISFKEEKINIKRINSADLIYISNQYFLLSLGEDTMAFLTVLEDQVT